VGVNRRLSRLFGPIVIGFALVGPTALASAAVPATQITIGQWTHSIGQVRAPRVGCYHASYPALEWRTTRCEVAPRWPLAPARVAGSSSRGGPVAVGNNTDYSAVVSGTISQATGSFNDVSHGITETGQIDDSGPQVANEFTLQLNSEFFSSAACSKSSDPAGCEGWQQFVYETDDNLVYMQYWLINYDATCPSGWNTFGEDCYTNSPASTYSSGPLTAADLASVKFVGSAKSGGDDQVSLSAGPGTATMVSNNDDMVDLAKSWNTTEFDVFGDGGGGQANFGANTTLEAQTSLVETSQLAPTCTLEGFTGETNNLNLSGTPALGAEESPTIESAQTNGTATTASCATIGGPIKTATALSFAPSSPATNQAVTLTATVTPNSATPSGTVAFENHGTAISGCATRPVALNGPSYTATCQTSFSAASSPESLSATFTPSSFRLGTSTSSAEKLVLAKASTATSLGVSNAVPAVGQSVTYTATVTPSPSGSVQPSGSVEFLDGGSAISTCSSQALSGGTATCTVSYASTGSHSITATYLGDPNFTGSTSSGKTVVVSKASTATSLGVSSALPVVGQSVTYTATVTPSPSGSVQPSGSVEFLDAGSAISTCSDQPLSGGAATCTVSYASTGSHSITATYLGNANFTGSTSSGQTVSVEQPVPAIISPPTIGGTTRQGQTLTESHGTWSNGPATYKYQWYDCDGDGANCVAIAGATLQTYKLMTSDIGHTIRVVETAINVGGAGTPASSGATAVVAVSGTQVKAALDRVLAPSGKAARIAAILKAGGYAYTFTAPGAGSLVVDWYATVKRKKVLVAVTSRVIHSAGKASEKLKLTSKGRELLKTTRRLKILSTATFTPTGTTSTTAIRAFTLKR
jgi:hypothetical protein